jgi:hypothetical protein
VRAEGFVGVGGLEVGALAGGFVPALEHPAALAATGEPETGLYLIHATERIILTGSGKSASSGRVMPVTLSYDGVTMLQIVVSWFT